MALDQRRMRFGLIAESPPPLNPRPVLRQPARRRELAPTAFRQTLSPFPRSGQLRPGAGRRSLAYQRKRHRQSAMQVWPWAALLLRQVPRTKAAQQVPRSPPRASPSVEHWRRLRESRRLGAKTLPPPLVPRPDQQLRRAERTPALAGGWWSSGPEPQLSGQPPVGRPQREPPSPRQQVWWGHQLPRVELAKLGQESNLVPFRRSAPSGSPGDSVSRTEVLAWLPEPRW